MFDSLARWVARNWKRLLLWALAITVSVPLVYLSVLFWAFVDAGSCTYDVLSEEVSPDGRYKAAVVEEGCNATVGGHQLVILTKPSRVIKDARDAVAAVHGEDVRIAWAGPILRVSYHRSDDLDVRRRLPTVSYETFCVPGHDDDCDAPAP